MNTLDVINTQDQISMVLYDYADPFMIKDGTCNLQDKINTSLNNNINPNVMDLEDMNGDWKKLRYYLLVQKERLLRMDLSHRICGLKQLLIIHV